MAAATYDEANALVADAPCDQSCLPPGLIMYAILAALIDIGNGDPVPDAQTLASEANCLLCVISPGLVPYAILQALRGISSGGIGGSGVTCGSGAPVAAPASGCGLYINTDDGSLFSYYSGAWH